MSARKKNRNRNTWSPQDDLAFEMAKRDEAAAAEDVKKAEAEQAKSSEAEAPNEEPVTSTIDETALLEREEALKSKQSNLDEREKEIKKREDALAEREAQIVEQGITLEAKASELEQLELDVVERETAVRKAESERDEGYRLAKSKHDQLLQDEDEKSKSTIAQREQEAIKALQENLARIRSEHDASLKEELKAARASIAVERASWKEEYKRQSASSAELLMPNKVTWIDGSKTLIWSSLDSIVSESASKTDWKRKRGSLTLLRRSERKREKTNLKRSNKLTAMNVKGFSSS